LREAAYNEARVEVETLESSIVMAELELTELVDELNVIFEELQKCKRGEGCHYGLNLSYTLIDLYVMHQT
jgi:hypothetical protein